MKLETLSLKTIINKLYFLNKTVIFKQLLFNETFEEKILIAAYKQINRKNT